MNYTILIIISILSAQSNAETEHKFYCRSNDGTLQLTQNNVIEIRLDPNTNQAQLHIFHNSNGTFPNGAETIVFIDETNPDRDPGRLRLLESFDSKFIAFVQETGCGTSQHQIGYYTEEFKYKGQHIKEDRSEVIVEMSCQQTVFQTSRCKKP